MTILSPILSFDPFPCNGTAGCIVPVHWKVIEVQAKEKKCLLIIEHQYFMAAPYWIQFEFNQVKWFDLFSYRLREPIPHYQQLILQRKCTPKLRRTNRNNTDTIYVRTFWRFLIVDMLIVISKTEVD